MPFLQTEPTEAAAAVWFRLAAPVDVPLAVHQAILAYASDFSLISMALLPHAVHDVRHRFQGASLAHTLWFHDPFRSDAPRDGTDCDSPFCTRWPPYHSKKKKLQK